MKTIMNVRLPEILTFGGKRIIFIHVGKCAGGSIIQSLSRVMSSDFTMFEMHVYESNRIIRDSVSNGPDDLTFLIATRHPIDRFISSFNWDKHNLYLSKESKSLQITKWFEEFPSVDALARSLADKDPEKASRALRFARFGHMGMGQSWYTPLDLISKFPNGRTFLCESESFSRDINNFVWAMNEDTQGRNIDVFYDKSSFTDEYDNADELFSKELSQEGCRNLRILLNEDVLAWVQLRERFGRVDA